MVIGIMNIKEFVSKKNWVTRVKNSGYAKRKMFENMIILQTPFLPETATLQQRGWHILHDVNSVPKCPVCKGMLKFQRTNKYSKYCSYACIANSDETKSKKSATIVEKYGSVDLYQKQKTEKYKKTVLEKYGVENPFQSEEVKEKIRQTKKNPLD